MINIWDSKSHGHALGSVSIFYILIVSIYYTIY